MPKGPRKYMFDLKGRYEGPSRFKMPEGACLSLQNVGLHYPGLIERAPGLAKGTGTVADSFNALYVPPPIVAGATYNSISQMGTAAAAPTFYVWPHIATPAQCVSVSAAAWPATATDNPASRFEVGGGRLYATSTNGVRRWRGGLADSISAGSHPVDWAGMPAGSAVNYGLTGSAGTALPDLYGRAYRVTWHVKDKSGAVIGGPPTGRCTARNITGTSAGYVASQTADVLLRIPVPPQFGTKSTAMTTSFFWRLWASKTALLSVSDPDDEMYLVTEAYLTSAQITAGEVQVTDTTPDAYLIAQDKLHTNQTNFPGGEEGKAQGAVNADNPPPFSYELAYWQDCMWYGNTCQLPSVLIKTLTSLADGDVITVDGVAFTCKAAPTTNQHFRLHTTYASAFANIEETIANFCHTLNMYTASSINSRAYPVSMPGQLPGAFLIQRKSWDAAGSFLSTLTVSSSVAKFSPDINATPESVTNLPGVDYVSNGQPNALWFSKPNRPDNVPPVNELLVGPTGTRILSLRPFRDRLLVFTTAGIYQVTGRSFEDFSVSPFDLSRVSIGRFADCVCDDRIYVYTFQGALEIDDGGAQIISENIDADYRNYAYALTETDKRKMFAFGDTFEHDVHFAQSSNSYVFNTRTREWCTRLWNVVNADGTTSAALSRRWRCAAVSVYGQALWGGEQIGGATNMSLFFQNKTGLSSSHVDYGNDGVGYSVQMNILWNYQEPDPSTMVHFQRIILGCIVDSSAPTTGLREILFSGPYGTGSFGSIGYNSTTWQPIEYPVDVTPNARRGSWIQIQFRDNTNGTLKVDSLTLLMAPSSGHQRGTT